ncbi:hypothetical protein B0J12DRAFT_734991 [Macrophomina phaseolina]|uniref:Uncharacterized protein n=1 Tax=Macrophomina phaseolina TaxID=35725 RepID=A0ABQ8GRE0_9PEZI|nr:hypothetical protein B0J12DRAFT_734991 [Macrophomina phaseolina]
MTAPAGNLRPDKAEEHTTEGPVNTKARCSGRAVACGPFRWAALPRELRNAIYSMFLSTENSISLKVFWDTCVRRYRLLWKPLPLDRFSTPAERHEIEQRKLFTELLLVSKATYAEAGAVLYMNAFEFNSAAALCTFLGRLSEQARGWVRHFRLDAWSACAHSPGENMRFGTLYTVVNKLLTTSNITRLCLRTTIDSVGTRNVSTVAKVFYSEAIPWLKAVGSANGDPKAAADLIEMDFVDSDGRQLWGKQDFRIELKKLLR